jgi:mannose-6-phosphate isomerase-like protein (cupin superfamily)
MSTEHWMFGLQEAQAKLPDDPAVSRIYYGLKHGTMKVGLYAPRERDDQAPHKQDELYIVISGTGEFVKHKERRSFKAQDVLFVEAGAEHRFEKFSSDFSAWVIFWGPENGES